MRKSQIRPMQIPEEHRIPDEVVLDVYFDATERYELGEVKSKEAQGDKEDLLAMVDNLIDSVREEAFCKGYRLGYSHGLDGHPDADEFDEPDAEEEGWT